MMATNSQIRAYAKQHGLSKAEAKLALNERGDRKYEIADFHVYTGRNLNSSSDAVPMIITPFGVSNQHIGVTSIQAYEGAHDMPWLKLPTELNSRYVSAKHSFGQNGLREWVIVLENLHTSSAIEIHYIAPKKPTETEGATMAQTLLLKAIDQLKERPSEAGNLWSLFSAFLNEHMSGKTRVDIMPSPHTIGIVPFEVDLKHTSYGSRLRAA